MKLIRFFLSLLMLLVLSGAARVQAATDYVAVMNDLLASGDQAAQQYNPDRSLESGNSFSQLYFGHFEGQGLEYAVGQKDQAAMLEIEIKFSLLTNAAISGKPTTEIQQHWQELRALLSAAEMLESRGASFVELVIQSMLILLREGIEAMLVIAALIAYLRKSGAADRVTYIWLGAAAAVAASILTAWALHKLISASGSAREALEGLTMLIAAALLSYVSVWLLSRREMEQWQGFIQNRLDRAVSGSSLWAIVSVAFLAVYREGAETILFYQAMLGEVEGEWQAVGTGIGLACLALLVVWVLIFQLSVRLPLKQFFTATAGLLFSLSVIFAGKAVLELQVAGWLPNTQVTGIPVVSWLGLFPSVESLGAQLLFLLLPVAGWWLLKQFGDRSSSEAQPG